MTTIWLTRGLPASGKSTWAKQQVAYSDGLMVRVNMDDIRSMLGFGEGEAVSWDKALEATALDVQDKAILAAVNAGHDVVVDNTHLEEKMPKRIKRLFDGEVTFRVKDFSHVSVDECITRDWERAIDGQRSVGEKVIKDKAARMKNAKWVLTEKYMNDVVLSPAYVPDRSKPLALLVDIDGTLAKHVARSPYDYSRVLTDDLHQHISDLLFKYSNYDGYHIILMSGRPDINYVRKDTEQWLHSFGVPFDALLMRPADMLKENDADVKQYLFDTHVRNNYWVEFMLDDRNRVVRRMRKLGIPVLQVADGNF